jgi:outer membrane translocation and assembly module TamA
LPTNEELCPKVFIHSTEKIKLSEGEKKLICGDPEDEAYKIIPIYQAKYMLQGFLQSRGYSHPRFIYNKEILDIFTEEKSRVNIIEVNTNNQIDTKEFKGDILQRFRKEVITPKLLDDIEAGVKSKARNKSYPCVKISSIVEPLEEKVTLTLSDLKSFNFGPLTQEQIEGINQVALKRFTSFKSEDPFAESELLLTEKRYVRQGVVQGTYFQENCDLANNSFSLQQNFIIGLPHTIRFGIGASTELGPMARINWTNQRYDSMASTLEARLQASFKNQSIILQANSFFWESFPRRSLNSELSFVRSDQLTFNESIAKFKPQIQWSRDTQFRFWQWALGPTLIASTYKTDLNPNSKSFTTGAVEGDLLSKTHSYEIFDLHPEEGEFFQFNFDFRHPSLGFIDPLLKLDLSYLKLIWLGSLGKGSSVAGFRISTSTTWVKESVQSSSLPPSVKYYGGGSDDLRGFNLNSLPDNNGLGALTKLSAKLELRKTYFFIPTIEVFTFLDTSYFGTKSWNLEPRLWYSPGLGIRWLSPIGLVQTYIARTLTNKPSANHAQDEGTLFFFGMGGVF